MTNQMLHPSIQAELINLLHEAHTADHAFIDSLSEAEKVRIGTLEHWSPKDVLAHVAFWRGNSIKRLDAVLNGTTPPDFSDLNHLNDATHETQRERPWLEVVADVDTILAALVAHVERFSDEQLNGTHLYPQQGGNPLWQGIMGNGYIHPQMHYSEYYVKNNNMARAITLNEKMAEEIGKVGGTRGRAVGLYNLACFYALVHQPAKALALLPEPLKLDPDLVELSKQDSDLDSLRSDPAFKALYTA